LSLQNRRQGSAGSLLLGKNEQIHGPPPARGPFSGDQVPPVWALEFLRISLPNYCLDSELTGPEL
jgi:hypothetical protein